MKKLIAFLLLFTLILTAFVSCAEEDKTQMRVGYLTGPTGFGMAKLINDNGGYENGNEKYSFKNYADKTADALADLTAGNVDAVCAPTNNVAQYYNSVDKNITVLSINTLGSLYLVAKSDIEINDLDDLNGKTIYTCKNGTPKVVLDKILEKAGINATVSTEANGEAIGAPGQLPPLIIKNKIDIAVLPEPLVSNALSKNTSFSVKLNLGEEWKDEFGTELSMGCIVANKTFVEEHPEVIKNFLKEYEASIEFMSNEDNFDLAADYILKEGVLPAANFNKETAKKALNNLKNSIAYIDGKEMKETLKSFYSELGIISPDDEFYH